MFAVYKCRLCLGGRLQEYGCGLHLWCNCQILVNPISKCGQIRSDRFWGNPRSWYERFLWAFTVFCFIFSLILNFWEYRRLLERRASFSWHGAPQGGKWCHEGLERRPNCSLGYLQLSTDDGLGPKPRTFLRGTRRTWWKCQDFCYSLCAYLHIDCLGISNL